MDEDDDEYFDEFDTAASECGLMDDGTCMNAGTEHCDFECPFRDGL